jgi:hypothetical protein
MEETHAEARENAEECQCDGLCLDEVGRVHEGPSEAELTRAVEVEGEIYQGFTTRTKEYRYVNVR